MRADGAGHFGDRVGSIHRIGALAQGLDGSTAGRLDVETDKGLTPIDTFRAQVRSEMAEAAE